MASRVIFYPSSIFCPIYRYRGYVSTPWMKRKTLWVFLPSQFFTRLQKIAISQLKKKGFNPGSEFLGEFSRHLSCAFLDRALCANLPQKTVEDLVGLCTENEGKRRFFLRVFLWREGRVGWVPYPRPFSGGLSRLMWESGAALIGANEPLSLFRQN